MSLAAFSRAAEMRPAAALSDIERWLSRVDSRRLGNGLTVCVAADRRAPLVASAIAYRAGTRDEPAGHGGVAHYLEHMMFKGSANYGAGEIDRQTQAAGGTNNAFTSHDLTLYYFTFASDRWQLALDIEADRMSGLRLEAAEVAAERQVIHEEIAMYEGEAWDMLLHEVQASFFGPHPYGRPVLGTRAELDATAAKELEAFHSAFYRPEGAVVVVVGDVDVDAAHEAVARRFEAFSAGVAPRPQPPSPISSSRLIERRQGELARLEIAMPAPAANDPDHAALRLLCGVLTLGRSSRLHRVLVDDSQSCLWTSADLQDTLDPGLVSITAELVPGSDPRWVEAEILANLRRLNEQPPSGEEIARLRQVMLADWLFGHERMDQRAFLLGGAAAVVDLDYPARSLRQMLEASPDQLLDLARRHLNPETAVIGWSWPEEDQ